MNETARYRLPGLIGTPEVMPTGKTPSAQELTTVIETNCASILLADRREINRYKLPNVSSFYTFILFHSASIFIKANLLIVKARF
jgi:hypothetical protein